MANNIKIGAGIALDGEKEFKSAVSSINKDLSVLGSEMGKISAEYSQNGKSMDALTAKSSTYNKQVETQGKKVQTLTTALESAKKEYGENSTQAKNWQISLNKAEAELSKTETQLKQNNTAISEYSRNQLAAAKNSDEFKNAQHTLGKAFDVVKIAAVAVTASIVAFTAQALQTADEMQALSDKTGLSAERLQELKYAGDNLGVSLETITGAQAKLTKSMSAAEAGTGKQAGAFARLGISVTDQSGQLRDAKVVMEETINALGGMKNSTERDALAMQIFGKSAMELNPIIKAGGDTLAQLSAEARTNGAVMSNEAIVGLDTFGDTLENVKTALTGKFGEAFAKITPQLTDFATKVSDIDVTPLVDGLSFAIENFDKIKVAAVAAGAVFAIYKGVVVTTTLAEAAHTIAVIAGARAATGAATATTAQSTATVASTAVTKAATIAQAAMNIATKAFPALLIVAALALIVTNWKEISKAIKAAWDWLTKWNDTDAKNKDIKENKVMSKATRTRFYATGTTSAASGWNVVGENGPELMNFRGGETVLNATKSLRAVKESAPVQQYQQPRQYTLNINTQLDGRIVAKKVYEFTEEISGLRGVNLVEG